MNKVLHQRIIRSARFVNSKSWDRAEMLIGLFLVGLILFFSLKMFASPGQSPKISAIDQTVQISKNTDHISTLEFRVSALENYKQAISDKVELQFLEMSTRQTRIETQLDSIKTIVMIICIAVLGIVVNTVMTIAKNYAKRVVNNDTVES